MSQQLDDNLINFIACPNHDTNVGWRKLRFIAKDKIKCDECGKEFTFEEIKQMIGKDFQLQMLDLQRSYQQNIAALYYKNEKMDEVVEIEYDDRLHLTAKREFPPDDK
jgi:hypothetical protein